MSRPLRLEFAGALYYIASRGNGRNLIYLQDDDFELFLQVLADVCERYNWVVHAYCLMSNHYHLLVETPDANLSQGMRQLNGVFKQSMNRKHHRVGHLFQGRYKAILVDKDAYLLELCRYIVLNPIRANMVNSPDEWP
jgi:putative transposase